MQAKELKRIELSNYGEAFLNPSLLHFLAYADQKGVAISIAPANIKRSRMFKNSARKPFAIY